MSSERSHASGPTEPPRRNAAKLFMGTEPFVDDLPIDGDWLGGTVRSKVAHGHLRKLNFDPSFDWSRVVVVTAEDIPGKNVVACLEEDQPCLCDGTIRHCGEPIALVAAPDRDTLREALAAIEAIVEPLPPVFDPFESLKGEIPIFGATNVFLEIPIHKGNVEKALRDAYKVVETDHHTPAQEHVYLETQGMRAVFENGRYRIEGSIQCPYYLVEGVARLMGVAESDVRVIVRQTGGGFGGKEDFPTMLAGHVALLARKSGHPVRMIYDRVQDMTVTTKRHPSWIRRKTGLSRTGEILAAEVDIVLDSGAYATLSPFVLSRAALHAVGPYRCENVSIRARAVATHHPPNGGFRGFGCPQVHFATETHMDACAEALGIDPIEIRRRNVLRPGDTMPFGQVLGADTNYERLLAEAIDRTGFEIRRGEILAKAGKSRHEPLAAEGHVRRGIGLSLFMHGTGLNGYWERTARSRVCLQACDDGRVAVLTAQTEFGQGTLTALARITALAVGIDEADVVIDHPDTGIVPNSGPTVASRTVSIVRDLIREAAEKLRGKIRDFAGPEVLEDPAILKAAIARCMAEGHAMAFEAEYETSARENVDDRWSPVDAYPQYAGGCCVAEVEVDRLTGEVAVTHLDYVCDIGEVISHAMATNQVIGGAAQGLGWAVTEHVAWSDQGVMKNARFSDYAIPSACDMPPVGVIFLESDESGAPRHSKGLGELPMEGPAPAIANAVAMATGRRPERLPVRQAPAQLDEVGVQP